MRVVAILIALLALPTIIIGQEVTPPTSVPAMLKDISGTAIDTATGLAIDFIFTITGFSYDEPTGRLLASGNLNNQEFTNKPVGLIADPAPPSVGDNARRQLRALQGTNPAVCDVLFLDLKGLFLDVLGLTVDLDPVVLDINAVPGAGNLLGNLLCALVGLLDGGLFGLLGGLGGLSLLTTIINQILTGINGLLG